MSSEQLPDWRFLQRRGAKANDQPALATADTRSVHGNVRPSPALLVCALLSWLAGGNRRICVAISEDLLLRALRHRQLLEERMDQEHEERIKKRAYAIWEREGRQEGGHEGHWSQAEQELRDEEPGEREQDGDRSGQTAAGGTRGAGAGGTKAPGASRKKT